MPQLSRGERGVPHGAPSLGQPTYNGEGGFTVANPNRARMGNQGAVPQPQPILAPNWFLGLIPRELWDRKKIFFIYTADFLPLGISATATVNTQIQNDSHFVCIGGAALVTNTTDTTVINSPSGANASGKLVQITDVAAGFPLSQVPVPLENLLGSGQLPAVWALPKLFRKGTTIATQVQNLIATAHNVRISYWGIRIYPDIPAESV